jgi:hypothetical protein
MVEALKCWMDWLVTANPDCESDHGKKAACLLECCPNLFRRRHSPSTCHAEGHPVFEPCLCPHQVPQRGRPLQPGHSLYIRGATASAPGSAQDMTAGVCPWVTDRLTLGDYAVLQNSPMDSLVLIRQCFTSHSVMLSAPFQFISFSLLQTCQTWWS